MCCKFRNMLFCLVFLLILNAGTAIAEKKTVVFADLNWDSVKVHNRIAGFIIKNGLGHRVGYLADETVASMVTRLMRGDVDVDMEFWIQNIPELYNKGINSGKIVDLGPNYPDSCWQGWVVPTYMIKGDAKRGIKPVIPNVRSVADMAGCREIFRDAEDSSKGLFYNSVPGWVVTRINAEKLRAYGLDKYYDQFLPESDAVLDQSIVSAYEQGKPWFGYYWAPTWIMGKFDMTPLEEPPFDQEIWDNTRKCAFRPVNVNIIVNAGLPEQMPDVAEFLEKYETTKDICNKFLAYMFENKADAQTVAVWFLKNNEPLWTRWVSEDTAAKVKAALKQDFL